MARAQWTLVTLALFVASAAVAQTHSLSARFGGPGFDNATALALDPTQRIVVAGRYSDEMNLGGGNFVATGDHDNYLAVFDEVGNHVWSRNFVGSAANTLHAIAVDDTGDIVLVGDGSGTIDLGGGDLSLSTDGAFAARYDAQGNHLWSRTVALGPGSDANDVAFDPDGNIVITGQELLTDSSVIELDADGNGVWENGNSAVGDGVAVDPLGNVYAAGVFSYSTSFGDSTIMGVGILDGFLVSYDDAGSLRWFRTFTDDSWCGAQDVAVDSENRVWMSGYFNWILDFGSGPIQSSSAFENFVSVFDPSDGSSICAQAFANGGSSSGISYLRSGDGIALATSFVDSVDTGSGVLHSLGGTDVFVTAFSGPCAPAWSLRVGGSGEDLVHALDLGQGFAIAGSFEQSVDFGGGNLVSAGATDGFVARYLASLTAAPLPSPSSHGWLHATPNPWNSRTTIAFDLPVTGTATLELFDSRGRRIRTLLAHEHMTAGEHRIPFEDDRLASGVYHLRLTHPTGELRRTIVLLK